MLLCAAINRLVGEGTLVAAHVIARAGHSHVRIGSLLGYSDTADATKAGFERCYENVLKTLKTKQGTCSSHIVAAGLQERQVSAPNNTHKKSSSPTGLALHPSYVH